MLANEDELLVTIAALNNAAHNLGTEACHRYLSGESEDAERLEAAREWCLVRAEALTEIVSEEE